MSGNAPLHPQGRAPAGRGLLPAALLRWAPVALVVLALVLGYAFGLHRYLSLDALQSSEAKLKAFVDNNVAAAAASYALVYVAAVALSFPGASILTAAGGFMFGCWAGTALAVVSATAGATFIFLIARTSFGSVLAERAGPRVQKLRTGFAEEGFSYLLFLRLVPLFPFWIVNLAAAVFGMRLLPYVAATAIGIIPGTFVLAYFGGGLETAIAHGGLEVPKELLLGLALLGLLAIVPVLVRKWRQRRGEVRT